MSSRNDSSLPEDQLPDAIIHELRNSDFVPFEIPPQRTAKILQEARRGLVTRRPVRRTRAWVRATAVISSFCAALLVCVVTQLGDKPQPAVGRQAIVTKPAQPASGSKDVDDNGTVNILDAYLMARLLESGSPGDKWDFNEDGQLNEDDIRLVAFEAVML